MPKKKEPTPEPEFDPTEPEAPASSPSGTRRRVGDYAPSGPIFGDLPRASADAVLGKVIELLDARLLQSQYGEDRQYAVIKARLVSGKLAAQQGDPPEDVLVTPGQEFTFSTGSGRSVDQIKAFSDAFKAGETVGPALFRIRPESNNVREFVDA